MRIKLIQAPNMAEAMRRVRAELGEDALILGNRRIAGGVELTAALEPPPEDLFNSAPLLRPAAAVPTNPPPDPRASEVCSKRRAEKLRYGVLDWSKPIMLVGAPGAGKTLTAAKLATRLVRQGEAPLLVTTDQDRAGATEQLAALARILQLDLAVAENPLVLARLLAMKGTEPKAIIDMAGCNPFDEEQSEMLASFAVAADALLVWVISAGLDAEDAADMAEAFAALGARHMIATKLDLTRRLESVLRAAEIGDFTLTDAGVGAGIVDGIIPLGPEELIERIGAAEAYLKTRQIA
jgi:flagellar biosynthesis protein FlhF